MPNEEFEKYAARAGIVNVRDKNITFFAWNARQPEIDALILKNAELEGKILKHEVFESDEIARLKAKVQEKINNWFELLNKHDDLQRENTALKAQVVDLQSVIGGITESCTEYDREKVYQIKGLQAEVEKLRVDAERLDWMEAHPRLGEIHIDGEARDCYLYAVSGALGVPLRAIIDSTMKETKSTPDSKLDDDYELDADLMPGGFQ